MGDLDDLKKAEGAMSDAPASETMSDSGYAGILSKEKGLLIRQKLDVWELVLPLWEKRNKYKVAGLPEWDKPLDEVVDKDFKKALKKNEVLTMKEKSECCQRICCGPRREFKMKVKAGDDVKDAEEDQGKVLEFFRPFKCTLNFCNLCLVMPQEISVTDTDDKQLGRVVQALRLPGSCCCKQYWEIKDDKDEVKYILEDNLCKSCNCLAPSFCCHVRGMEIKDANLSEEPVGKFSNVWPGCGKRGCIGDADNYVLEFPKDANPQDKATLLAAAVLVDFMLFEKDDSDGNGVQVEM